ncbi:hypothetical protein Tco_1076836 [Tanacetum coccineum]
MSLHPNQQMIVGLVSSSTNKELKPSEPCSFLERLLNLFHELLSPFSVFVDFVERNITEFMDLIGSHQSFPVVSPFLHNTSRMTQDSIQHFLVETSFYELWLLIIKQRVKVNQKARILELKRRNHEEHCSDNLLGIKGLYKVNIGGLT